MLRVKSTEANTVTVLREGTERWQQTSSAYFQFRHTEEAVCLYCDSRNSRSLEVREGTKQHAEFQPNNAASEGSADLLSLG